MPPKTIIPEAREITVRFIESFNELRYRKLVKTKSEFCEAVGLVVSSNLSRMEKEDSMSEPTLTNIMLLVKKYNVSIEWLMLGVGPVISK
jgi:phage regulator Rha-like protein